ncbi:MAG: hypothetical protein QNJ81_00780 [Acidimicrobiia bacterium]|nr:hypothetical protein [Acidimicrobiia bacterium]
MRFTTVALVLVAVSACAGPSDSPTTAGADFTPTTTSTTSVVTATSPANPAPTTTAPATTTTPPPEPASFDIPVGMNGVTYDATGSPATGPSSFAVLDDGSIVVADTIAVKRGEPRLLIFDAAGQPSGTIDLAQYEVDVVSDVATDGTAIALLDINLDVLRYRVHILTGSGELQSTYELPLGYRLEDGLTGLAWDDDGILLEFEFGARYARVGADGFAPVDGPSYGGAMVAVTPREGRETFVSIGMDEYFVTRGTDLGGVTVLGAAPDGTTVILISEVDLSGEAIAVSWRIQRRSADGEVLGEVRFDVAEQFVEIERAFELGSDGRVRYLLAREDRVTVVILDI